MECGPVSQGTEVSRQEPERILANNACADDPSYDSQCVPLQARQPRIRVQVPQDTTPLEAGFTGLAIHTPERSGFPAILGTARFGTTERFRTIVASVPTSSPSVPNESP